MGCEIEFLVCCVWSQWPFARTVCFGRPWDLKEEGKEKKGGRVATPWALENLKLWLLLMLMLVAAVEAEDDFRPQDVEYLDYECLVRAPEAGRSPLMLHWYFSYFSFYVGPPISAWTD